MSLLRLPGQLSTNDTISSFFVSNLPCLKAQVSLLPSKFLQYERGDPLPGLRNLSFLAFMYFKELMYFGWKCGNVFFLLPPPELTLRLVISKGRMRAGN